MSQVLIVDCRSECSYLVPFEKVSDDQFKLLKTGKRDMVSHLFHTDWKKYGNSDSQMNLWAEEDYISTVFIF